MEKKTAKILFIILLAGFALRAGFFLAVRPWNPEVLKQRILIGDAAGYHAIAGGIVQTRSFVKDPEVIRTPGYPLFLASVYVLFGEHPWLALLFQVFLNTAAIVMVYRLAYRYFAGTTALIAAALYAVEPHVVTHCTYLLTETLFSALILAAVYAFAAGLQDRRMPLIALSGLLTGIATMVRPISQFLPVVAVLLLALHYRKTLLQAIRPAVLFLVLFTAAVLPWSLRNYSRYGRLSFTTIDAVNLLYYNAAYAEQYRTGKELQYIIAGFREQERALLPPGETNPFAAADAMKKIAFDYLRTWPSAFFRTYARGNVNTFINLTASETCAMLGIPKVEQAYDFASFTNYLEMVRWFFSYKNLYEISLGLLIAFFLLIVYGAAAAEAYHLARNGDLSFLFPAAVLILYFSLLPGIVGVSRFKLPFIYLYLILAAEGLRRAAAAFKIAKRPIISYNKLS